MKYLLTVAYDGSRYCGYQKQKNGISVQEVLTDAATAIFGECKVTGCSRTDSGVHAIGFKATIECTPVSIPDKRVAAAMNRYLPDDVAVIDSVAVSDDFHPRYSVRSKEYRYVIYNGEARDPFMRNKAYHYSKELDTDRMNEAAAYLVGTHDFAVFMASGSDVTDTVRTIYSCNVVRSGNIVTISVKGNGFLYNMVRIIVGTLISVSEGRLSPSDIQGIIESKDRKKAGFTAPPYGLYLCNVEY